MKPKDNTQKPGISDDISQLAQVLKALGHPARLEIIRQLAVRERCCGGDFCECLPLAQSTISQHLEMLRAVGLVDWQAEGTRSIYSLNRPRLGALAQELVNITGFRGC